MPRYSDRYSDRYSGSSTRLYVGHLSSRTRTYDLEDLFRRYGRVRDVDMKRDYAFVEFSDPRDADDARHRLNGRDIDGSRITVEFAKGAPRGPGGSRDYGGRGPPPGSGRCFNCGIDGHWARDCKAGDWKNKCYRCGERGHIERNCQNSPKPLRRGRSYSRSPSPRRRSPPSRRGRSRSRSFSRSRSYSQPRSPVKRDRSRSPVKRDRAVERDDRSRSPRTSRSPKRQRGSPVSSRGRKHTPSPSPSPSPDERSSLPRGSSSPTPRDERQANGSDYGGSPSPMPRSRSPMDEEAERESPRDGNSRSPYKEENGRDRSSGSPGVPVSPVARNGRSGRDDDDDEEDEYQASPRGSE